MLNDVIFPAPLKEGDTIAICTPAGHVKSEKINGAREVLMEQGWKVRVMPHAYDQYGSYGGTRKNRLADMREALTDPEVRAVLCSRGGYGVVHILDDLDEIDLRDDPKWIIGFSDISAIHALCNRQGIASIHGSMAGHIMLGAGDVDNAALFDILRGGRPAYIFNSAPQFDRPGTAEGRLIGGNLAVLAHLMGTRYDVFQPETVLFIEDVAEPIYKVERMLYQLRMADVLPNLSGLVVGQFTDYGGDSSYQRMEHMIAEMVAPYSYPVAFNAPIGHVSHNIPLIENAQVTLKVTGTDSNSLVFWPA